ncbi:MAG TPA: hypothetical protein VF808_14435 [Ktedonobacterales bacterium]
MSSPRGPQPGGTPADDSDLHSNGDNPYSAGSPRVDLTSAGTSAGYGLGSSAPLGYYTNPPVSGAGNPHSQGAQGWDSGAIDFGALYDDVLSSRQPSPSPQPTASDVYTDEGYGPNGTGRS